MVQLPPLGAAKWLGLCSQSCRWEGQGGLVWRKGGWLRRERWALGLSACPGPCCSSPALPGVSSWQRASWVQWRRVVASSLDFPLLGRKPAR